MNNANQKYELVLNAEELLSLKDALRALEHARRHANELEPESDRTLFVKCSVALERYYEYNAITE